jgi:predicted DsbA family dithiol-disulfide isomerase
MPMPAPPVTAGVVLRVEIWSDVVCPWCYIGKRRFETALSGFEHQDEVDVVWRSFELNPHSAPQEEGGLAERLARKYGMTLEQAKAANARVTAAAAGEGLDFRLDIAKPGNTFDAHRLIHLAQEQGLQGAAEERLMAAYFTEGRPVGDPNTLVNLLTEIGVSPDDARQTLKGDAHAASVREDEREAVELGISGVPFFVLDRRYGVSGAQPPDLILQALRQAWKDAHPIKIVAASSGDAPSCDDDACQIQ